jgi:hypothetical protein
MVLLVTLGAATLSESPPASYVQRFQSHFPERAQPRPLALLTDIAAYDQRYLEEPPPVLNNDQGDLAWQTSYRMASLNEMYRQTGQEKYLRLNTAWADRVMQARDDVTGRRRWNGQVGPVWSSVAYGRQGRSAYLVHTAMITYPILDSLVLRGVSTPADRALLAQLLSSLQAHDPQWRDGPGPGEGHYVYTREQDPDREGDPLPINRSSAMAKSLWLAWKLSGREEFRDKALAIGRFLKNRLHKTETGAYTWSYEVPLTAETEPRAAEDISHGALTASLAPLLAADGQVFDGGDLERFAATVVNGVAVSGAGVISGDVEGSEKADPDWVELPARWLEFAPYHGAVYPRIAEYYQRYDTDSNPYTASLATALLIRYRPIQADAPR